VSRHRQPSPPRTPSIQLDITLTLPRRVCWLLTGAAITHPHTLLGIAGNAGRLIRLLSG
jgi:hypothetical protein